MPSNRAAAQLVHMPPSQHNTRAAEQHLVLRYCSLPAGDNFYPSGLAAVEDPTFAKSFVDVYSERSLQASQPLVVCQPRLSALRG